MKRWAMLASVLAAGGLAAMPQPAAAQAVWDGDLFVTRLSRACLLFPPIGTVLHAVYRPSIGAPPIGQAKEALSLIAPNYAFLLEARGESLRGTPDVLATVIYQNSEFLQHVESETLGIAPAKIATDTPLVTITGTLRDPFLNNAGCEMVIAGELRPRG